MNIAKYKDTSQDVGWYNWSESQRFKNDIRKQVNTSLSHVSLLDTHIIKINQMKHTNMVEKQRKKNALLAHAYIATLY